jgi:hypothetical protein
MSTLRLLFIIQKISNSTAGFSVYLYNQNILCVLYQPSMNIQQLQKYIPSYQIDKYNGCTGLLFLIKHFGVQLAKLVLIL